MNSPSNITRGITRGTLADLPTETGIRPAFLGLGSNLGQAAESPAQTLQQALAPLAGLSDYPIVVSSYWRSTPIDCPPGSPDFVNAVVAMLPRTADPEALLTEMQRIENGFGRVRGAVRNAPRTLDLDLLSWGDMVLQSERLLLPHPRLHLRRFVLQPLAELAPEYVVPTHGVAVEILLERLALEQQSDTAQQCELQRINIAGTSVSL